MNSDDVPGTFLHVQKNVDKVHGKIPTESYRLAFDGSCGPLQKLYCMFIMTMTISFNFVPIM